MTCGIYKLVFNGLEDWPYVGQSRNIESRLSSHIRALQSGKGNLKMLEAYEMCGPPSLEVLEECCEYLLNAKEIEWINKLDSYNNGLNDTIGGDIYYGSGTKHYQSKYTREQIIAGMKSLLDPNLSITQAAKNVGMSYQALYQVYRGTTHNWFQEEFPNLYNEIKSIPRGINVGSGYEHNASKFTREQLLQVWKLLLDPKETYSAIEEKTGVSKTIISDIFSNRHHHWLQEEFPEEWVLMQSINRKTHSFYPKVLVKIISPTYEEFEIEDGYDLAKRIGETSTFASTINKVIKGEQKYHNGWHLPTSYTYLVKEGVTYKISKAEHGNFCRKHGIHRQSFNLLLANKQRQTKGFRLASENEIYLCNEGTKKFT